LSLDSAFKKQENSPATMVKDKLKSKMCVIKRDGRSEPVHFDKITSRIQKLCYGLNMDFIDPPAITFKVNIYSMGHET
jgi:hypothetical protein